MGGVIDRGGRDISFKAAADLSTKQFYCMKMSAADTVNTQTTGKGNVAGILQNKPDAANQAAIIRVDGTSKVVAGEAIAVAKHVTVTTAGKAEVVDAADELFFGTTLEASTADGDIIEIKLESGYSIASEA